MTCRIARTGVGSNLRDMRTISFLFVIISINITFGVLALCVFNYQKCAHNKTQNRLASTGIIAKQPQH
jgi:hypothetical protein